MKSLVGPGSRTSPVLTSCVTYDSHVTALGLSFPISKMRGLNRMFSQALPATTFCDAEPFWFSPF